MTAVTTPPSTSAEDIRRLARLLDSRFRVPGTNLRFGVDGLLGLVPGAGAAAGMALSTYVIVQAVALGARGATVGRMVANVAIDGVFGAIPVLGAAFDLWFTCNNRNVALLERHGIDPLGTEAWSRRSLRRTVIAVVVGVVAVAVLAMVAVGWLLQRLL